MATPYKNNYRKLSPDLHNSIAKLYESGKYTTEYLALTYGVSSRQIQRIAIKKGVIRTQAEANKAMAKHKRYHTIPEHMRVKRKHISRKLRYLTISSHPYCGTCGSQPEDGARLEVDHIDENPMNNEPSNLQVLCGQCNLGKSHLSRFP